MALLSGAVFYTEQQRGWMARWADARSGRPGLRGYPGLTLWGHGRSACGTIQTSRSQPDMSVYRGEAVKGTPRWK